MIFSPVIRENLHQYGKLFALCFPKATHLDIEYLDWLYFMNPAGDVVGFDALEDGQVVAHYVCVPVIYNVFSTPILGLLSLNTATLPSHQGKGLFTKLARLTYETAAVKNFKFVIGVANANSTPGFLKKLEFALIKPLEAFAFSPFFGMTEDADQLEFERKWSPVDLSWRLKNPKAKYSTKNDFLISKTAVPGLPVFSNRHRLNQSSFPIREGAIRPVAVFIGCPTFRCQRLMIPARLKPSPLNFIYRPLANERLDLQSMRIAIDFLDFDAY